MTVVDDMRAAAVQAGQMLEGTQNLGRQTHAIVEAHMSRLAMLGLEQVASTLARLTESLAGGVARVGAAKSSLDDATGMINTLPDAADANAALTTAQGCVDHSAAAVTSVHSVIVDLEPVAAAAVNSVQGTQSGAEVMGALSSYMGSLQDSANVANAARSALESGLAAFQSGG